MAFSTIIGMKDIICPKCGNNQSYIKIMNDSSQSEFGECTECGRLTYSIIKPYQETQAQIKCPYCGSTNTKKISSVSKLASAATFGILSLGKISKQWHCNKCNSNF